MDKNRLIIAAAGAGKTTYLVKQALKNKTGNIIITTYTEANEAEIRKKIIKLNKCIPVNITVQTWFSFLLQHGVRPYQGYLLEPKIKGIVLVNCRSGQKCTYQGKPIYFSEDTDFKQHYFTKDDKIYSDKLSKFVIRCNEISNSSVINRLSKIYSHIYIDEVQDLAGYDLEFIKLLFGSSLNVVLVGDPRQVTYLTHNESKYSKYKNGLIKGFIQKECKNNICEIDECSLCVSYRNNQIICDFAARLYPNMPLCKSEQDEETSHDGIFLIKPADVEYYLQMYNPIQLRQNKLTPVNEKYQVKNFGDSKGLGFDRVLIYPTKPIIQFLKDGKLKKESKDRKTGLKKESSAFDIAKFYVAVTRARFSVGIVYNYNATELFINGVKKFNISQEK
jgi:DNA helicase-2/ATP-dependent DNA helicase PcrA